MTQGCVSGCQKLPEGDSGCLWWGFPWGDENILELVGRVHGTVNVLSAAKRREGGRALMSLTLLQKEDSRVSSHERVLSTSSDSELGGRPGSSPSSSTEDLCDLGQKNGPGSYL